MSLRLFISYAHADAPFVDQLEADLQKLGFAPWVDRRGLAGGQKWRRQLQEAMDRAQVVLVVLSPKRSPRSMCRTNMAMPTMKANWSFRSTIVRAKCPWSCEAFSGSTFSTAMNRGSRPCGTCLRRDSSPPLPPLLSPSLSEPQAEPVALTEPAAVRRPVASNLPVQLTTLIGRQQEIAAVCRLLRESQVRLVTLTGPGGIGKTRLALQVATELGEQYADGVFLVALAPVSKAEQVLPAILQTLDISEQSGQAPLSRLKAALKDKHMLVLLDNFEQVSEAAVPLSDLLAACPRLSLLVTSQVLLHLQAEREFAVPPLSLPNPKHLPDLGTLSQYAAVALFIQRAQAVKAEFTRDQCQCPCGGRNLCAAGWTASGHRTGRGSRQVFCPAGLTGASGAESGALGGRSARPAEPGSKPCEGRLPGRIRLLSPQEQTLFRRLAVFVDGWSLEAAEVVCQAAGPLELELLEGLLSLADKSLLRQEESAEGEPRFGMLQVLRTFGFERLAEAEESEATRQAHAQYYLSLAKLAEPHLKGAEQARWMAQLAQDYENLRTALRFLLERAGQSQPSRSLYAQQALDLSLALQWFWVTHNGYLPEGRAFLRQALE